MGWVGESMGSFRLDDPNKECVHDTSGLGLISGEGGGGARGCSQIGQGQELVPIPTLNVLWYHVIIFSLM